MIWNIFFSGIFNRMVIILIYLLQKKIISKNHFHLWKAWRGWGQTEEIRFKNYLSIVKIVFKIILSGLSGLLKLI